MIVKRNLFILICGILFHYTCGHSQISSNKEDFSEFIYQFSSDSIFQISRVKFPFIYISLDEQFEDYDTILIKKQQWKFDPTYFDGQNISRVQFYNDFNMMIPDTDEKVINIIGINDGLNIRYYFERKNGLWYLIKKENFST